MATSSTIGFKPLISGFHPTWTPASGQGNSAPQPQDSVDLRGNDDQLRANRTMDELRKLAQSRKPAVEVKGDAKSTSERKEVTQTDDQTVTTVNGQVESVQRTGQPNESVRGRGYSVTQTDRNEISTEVKAGQVKLTNTAYTEETTSADGRANVTSTNGTPTGLVVEGGYSNTKKAGVKTELELNRDLSVSNTSELSTTTQVRAGVTNTQKEEAGDYNSTTMVDLGGSKDVKQTNTQTITSKSLDLSLDNINETTATGDAHLRGGSTIVANKNQLTLGTSVDYATEGNVQNKSTWRARTENGTSLSTSSEASVSEGLSFKLGGGFSRDNEKGTTEINFKIGGPVPVAPFIGVGKEVNLKVADKDIDRFVDVTNPLLPQSVKKQVSNVAKGALSTIPRVGSAVADKYVATKKAVVTGTSRVIRRAGEEIVTRGRQTVERAKKTYQQAKETVTKVYNNVTDTARQTYNRAADTASNVYNKASEMVNQGYTQATTWLRSWW